MIYTVPFEPVPMKYHRFGKNSRAYNPQARFKEQVRTILTLQHGNRKLYSGPLKFEVTYYMPIPASYSPKKQQSVAGSYHYSKPDTSNLQKLIEDCCSKRNPCTEPLDCIQGGNDEAKLMSLKLSTPLISTEYYSFFKYSNSIKQFSNYLIAIV